MNTTIGCPIPGASQPKEPVRLIDATPILKNIELDIMMLHGKADELGESAYAIQCTKDIVKLRYFAEWLKSIPTIDPESMRPTAHWISDSSGSTNVVCSACNAISFAVYNFFPHCGKRMVSVQKRMVNEDD